MIVDGRKIAEAIYEETRQTVAQLGRSPVLLIVTCDPNFETQKYLALKQKKALDVHIETKLASLRAESTTEDFISVIQRNKKNTDGIIVQLPLPSHIDTKTVLDAIPGTHDVDALGTSVAQVLSPVVGAIARILKVNAVDVAGKLVTIIGSGKLVGLPAYRWCTEHGAHVSVVTKDTIDIAHHTRQADIIICGAGVPGLLTPSMIKEGVVILDAGTSEEGGVLKGDADPACAEKASIFTPVPGGIGPITVAVLLQNVALLAR